MGGRRRRIDELESDVEGRGVNVVGRLVIGMEHHLYLYLKYSKYCLFIWVWGRGGEMKAELDTRD